MIGYLKVPGEPLAPNLPTTRTRPLAAQLGQIMLALHRFPREAAADAGVPEWDAQERAAEWRDTVLPIVRAEMTRAEYTRIVLWWDKFLSDRVLREYEPALVHGDLWYEHVLVDQSRSRITGIVDFESTRIGDPAQDCATQRHLGGAFACRVLTAYRAAGGRSDATMDYRIQKLWELREFDGLRFAVRAGDAAEVVDAIRKLRAGPVLNAASRE